MKEWIKYGGNGGGGELRDWRKDGEKGWGARGGGTKALQKK